MSKEFIEFLIVVGFTLVSTVGYLSISNWWYDRKMKIEACKSKSDVNDYKNNVYRRSL